jgi:hypothetical protein
MLGGGSLLRADVAADEHAHQKDDDRHDHGRHEQGKHLFATEMNLVETVVYFVVGYVSQWGLSVRRRPLATITRSLPRASPLLRVVNRSHVLISAELPVTFTRAGAGPGSEA